MELRQGNVHECVTHKHVCRLTLLQRSRCQRWHTRTRSYCQIPRLFPSRSRRHRYIFRRLHRTLRHRLQHHRHRGNHTNRRRTEPLHPTRLRGHLQRSCDPYHLPRSCQLLLGAAQINELDIAVDTHRKQQKQMLRSLNPDFVFSTTTKKELRLSEIELSKWAAHQQSTHASNATAYTYLDVDIDPALRPSEQKQIANINHKFQNVFLVTKGNVPTPADHPPVHLNFRPDWKHVSVPIPKWGRGAAQVLEHWARKQLRSGLFERSKSPSASRPHIVRKPPHDAPKHECSVTFMFPPDCDIDC
jgi:hypothetical protein